MCSIIFFVIRGLDVRKREIITQYVRVQLYLLGNLPVNENLMETRCKESEREREWRKRGEKKEHAFALDALMPALWRAFHFSSVEFNKLRSGSEPKSTLSRQTAVRHEREL